MFIYTGSISQVDQNGIVYGSFSAANGPYYPVIMDTEIRDRIPRQYGPYTDRIVRSELEQHLAKAHDALAFQQSWRAFEIIKSPDKSWYKSMGFRRNSFFPKRLTERAKYTMEDWRAFEHIQKQQYECFKKETQYLNWFVYKYALDVEPP